MVEHICERWVSTDLGPAWQERCGGEFHCWLCGRFFGWCVGCADELDREVVEKLDGDGVCDECWVEWTALRERALTGARAEAPCGSGPSGAARTGCTGSSPDGP